MKSLQGQLLVASAHLADPNFARSVVLLVQHDENGAMGLVLNRSLEMSVGDALSQSMDESYDGDETLHQGGPCEGPLMVLHTHEPVAQIKVIDGVCFSAERDSIAWLLKNNRGPIQFFAGYSGWAAGQLESELAAGGWSLAVATPRDAFGGDDDQWTAINARIALGRPISRRIIPNDPQSN